MTGKLSKNFHGVGIGPLSKILAVKAYSKVKNPKVESFLRAPEDFEGPRSQKNLIFQNAQIKV